MGTLGGVGFNQFTDGLSNTIFVGEKHIPRDKLGFGWWDCSSYNGDYSECSTRSGGVNFPLAVSLDDTGWKFGSMHTNVVQFTFGDGSVRPLPVNINPYILGLLVQRADGEIIPDY